MDKIGLLEDFFQIDGESHGYVTDSTQKCTLQIVFDVCCQGDTIVCTMVTTV